MDQHTADIRLAHWRQIIMEGNRASITKREWCKQNGISEKSFFYWQRKIRKMAADSFAEPADSLPAAMPGNNESAFVEIPMHAISPNIPGNDAIPSRISPELMVQVNDYLIFVTGSIHESTLKTVMKVIRDA